MCEHGSLSHYLSNLINFILKNLDKPNHYIILILLDLRKAFDLVDHNVLIEALLELEVDHNDVMWLAEFLRNRSQYTKDDNLLSDLIFISNGTPQGTKLAPLLFIILIT